ncbi:methyltransferase domain-containing protein [Paenibacillus sp. SYP-B3998]|uniref:Methyltransferase domain-containing protein n=1 Tax=Paenibacillus sp. SYP-B3998 TaxID=2678564 RepID=A0A6G4A6A1_9BACL|nr:class I SAM-dependent methyltransferase [Paenibacillus sp. SYP-B3998]NEW09850.1 methyltransferase domain-containing protein [Paenibacillus sp. SYP-B3998]
MVENEVKLPCGGAGTIEYLDMLAKLGVGNAHPGGFGETIEQLQKYPIAKGQRVLEVGCGTGRTACFLAEQGADVTAIDIRPEMVAKAKKRADKQNVQVQFMEGDACQLPFEDNSFDVLLVESVTNFADAKKAMSQYLRVLKPQGNLYDREVIRIKEMTPEIHGAICKFYGVSKLYSMEEWKELLENSGFVQVNFSGVHPFPQTMFEDQVQHPDPVHLSDKQSFMDPRIWQITAQYDELVNKYHTYLGYTLMLGSKEIETK